MQHICIKSGWIRLLWPAAFRRYAKALSLPSKGLCPIEAATWYGTSVSHVIVLWNSGTSTQSIAVLGSDSRRLPCQTTRIWRLALNFKPGSIPFRGVHASKVYGIVDSILTFRQNDTGLCWSCIYIWIWNYCMRSWVCSISREVVSQSTSTGLVILILPSEVWM